MVAADSDRIPRVPPYSGAILRRTSLPVRAFHPLRTDFPDGSGSSFDFLLMVLQPRVRLDAHGLGSSHFDRHYSGNRLFLSLPAGTKMFQFPAFAPSHDGVRPSTARVTPFGHLRIISCLQIPGAFRSLPRPSSPPEA